MKAFVMSLRFRVVVLALLLGMTGLATRQQADACQSCIVPDAGSGICIACTMSGCEGGNCLEWCEADQDHCGCFAGPDCSILIYP